MLFSRRRAKWTELPRTETIAPVPNPFCGLYTIYRFVVGEPHPDSEENLTIGQQPLKQNETLVLLELNLMLYKDKELSQTALADIRQILQYFSRNGKTILLRFLYDWDGVCLQTQPQNIRLILQHMEQVKPLMQQFTAFIYISQGLFVGNWGEMHGSRHTGVASLQCLYEKWRSCVGTHTWMAVRSPAQWRLLTGSFDPPTDESDPSILRLGLFNDGIMASATDLGTYGSLQQGMIQKPADKMPRPYELSFQQQLCRFVPNGGETVDPNPLNDAGQAICTLRTMHVSYLNSMYDQRIFQKWEQEKLPSQKGPWSRTSAKEWIIAHLGYRFMFRRVRVSPGKKQGRLSIQLQLENTGFSCCYRPLLAELRVSDTTETFFQITSLPANTRQWQPEAAIQLSAEIDITPFSTDRLLIAFRILDPVSGLFITPANAPVKPDAQGFMILGSAAAAR